MIENGKFYIFCHFPLFMYICVSNSHPHYQYYSQISSIDELGISGDSSQSNNNSFDEYNQNRTRADEIRAHCRRILNAIVGQPAVLVEKILDPERKRTYSCKSTSLL